MLKEHEKFWAFTMVLVTVVLLALLSKGETTYVMVDGKPVSVANGLSLRDALVGIIAILGTASQALFRVSETAKDMNDILRDTIGKLGDSTPTPKTPPAPQTVKDAADQVADAATDRADQIKGVEDAAN